MQSSSSNTLKSALSKVIKLEETVLEHVLTNVQVGQAVAPTRLVVNCHHVALDGSGLPRLKDLTDALSNWAQEYAIPRSILQSADSNDPRARRRKEAALHKEAIEVFKKTGVSGEQGELLLYVLSEALLGLPQLLCKMDLKTDPEMHFHGVDGVHCGLADDGKSLAVYWCESKVHKDVGNALAEAFDGLKPFLLGPGTGDRDKRRDLALVRRYMDLGDDELRALILNSLDPDKAEFNSISWRGICFVGFDHNGYPLKPNTKSAQQMLTEIKGELAAWTKSAKTMVTNRSLDSFVIHVIFVPFGFCADFREAMIASLSAAKP